MLYAVLLQTFLLLPAYPIPLHQLGFRQLPPLQVAWVTTYSTTSIEATAIELITVASEELSLAQSTAMKTPFFIAPIVPVLPSGQTVDQTIDQTIVSATTSTATDTVIEVSTSLVYLPPVTVTLTQAPTTVTDTAIVSSTPGSYWAAPAQFTDLSSFKITHFADGQQNLEVVNSLPSNISDPNKSSTFDPTKSEAYPALLNGDTLVDLTNSKSLLQLYYPADSINPGGDTPVGGADFYASPLPLSTVANVSLEYSVYFPENFEWVDGGKLPGLYGGHETCSGGDVATTCFSTRLMWRPGGAGELYLVRFLIFLVKRMPNELQYAPKDKQTYALCHTPPQSVCDEEYGLSIGRGSFYFTPGAWTDVRQTVTLNTPGQQDGGFTLEVNGQTVIGRNDVFYRDVPSATSTMISATSTSILNSGTDIQNGGTPSGDGGGGLLSPLVSGVLGPLGAVGGNGSILSVLKDSDGNSSDSDDQYSHRPPLLPNEEASFFMNGQATDDAASALMDNYTTAASPTSDLAFGYSALGTAVQQSAVTITSYVWPYITEGAAKAEKSAAPSPVPFTGLFFRYAEFALLNRRYQ